MTTLLKDNFKFTCHGSPVVYTAWRLPDDRYELTWPTTSPYALGKTTYSTADLQIHMACWDCKILDDTTDNLLAAIKQFTIDTGASVFICDGGYEVYYDSCDWPYKAATDEKLVEVMGAVRVLAEAMLQDASVGIA